MLASTMQNLKQKETSVLAPLILKRWIAVSYTDHLTFVSSGLEHRLNSRKIVQLCKGSKEELKGLFHPGCLARVVSLFASVAAIFMVHENGDEERQAK